MPLSIVDAILGIAPCGNKSLALNTFINTHMEMKKLKFHTPDTTGKSKCHKMHVGQHNQLCPELRVHGRAMECVDSDTYLGDVIASDGTNTLNIRKRISKGNGVISKIVNILESVSLGEHYFKIALLLRESLLLNAILSRLKGKLRNWKVLMSVPSVSLFLETGCISIGSSILSEFRIN